MIGQLLDQIRDYYVSRFIDAINEYSNTAGVKLAHEPAFCDANGDVVTEGQLALPLRGDLLVIRDGSVSDSVQIDTDGMLSFEPIAFDWPENNLNVDLHPFQWNWMQLRIFGLEADADWTPLRNWFIEWFQEKDPADGELLGGVHFLSDPESGDDYSQLSIDLGTAPVESFEELLDAIGLMGAASVHIGHFEQEGTYQTVAHRAAGRAGSDINVVRRGRVNGAVELNGLACVALSVELTHEFVGDRG